VIAKKVSPAIIALVMIVLLPAGCSRVDETLPLVDPVTPANGSTLDEADPVLRWTEVASPVRYQVELGNTHDFSSRPIIDERSLTQPHTSIPGYLHREIYYWRVRYRSESGTWSTWAGPWRFGTYLDVPALKTPKEDELLNGRFPRFSWSDEIDTTGYDIELYAAGSGGPIHIALGLSDPWNECPVELPSGAYRWRVRARYPEEIAGIWSDYGSFTIIDSWQRSYGRFADLVGFRAWASDSQGGELVMAGNLRTRSGSDVVVARIDEAGAVIGATRAAYRARDDAAAVVADETGFVCAATVSDEEGTRKDLWVFAGDNDATPVWQRVITAAPVESDESAADLVRLADGSIVVAGSITDESAGTPDGVILCLDPSGALLWQTSLGGNRSDTLSSITATAQAIYAVGTTRSCRSVGTALWITRVAYDGTVEWSAVCDSPLDESAGGPDSIIVTPNGTIYVAATSSEAGVFGGSMIVVALSEAGDLVGVFGFASEEHRSFATSIAAGSTDELVVGGNVLADSPTAGGLIRTPKVIRIAADGKIRRQHGSRGAYPRTVESVSIDEDGNVVMIGWHFEFNLDSAWASTIDADGPSPPDRSPIDLEPVSPELRSRFVSVDTNDGKLRVRPASGALTSYELESRLLWP
jgi:hypothetical protein